MVLAATQNHASSGLIRRSSTATIDIDIMALMLCPSALSVPTLMGYLHAYNALLQATHTMRRVDVVLVATSNDASSGQRRRCSTVTIDIDMMALMLCPSALSVPTFIGYLHAYNALLRSPHTMRRVDVVLAATSNHASSGQGRRCSTATIDIDIMALMLCPSALSVPTLIGHLHA